MSLRLIYSADERAAMAERRAPLSPGRVAAFAALAFFALKLPMLFMDVNPEELRDFDHFVRTASGEIAYRDFVWFYGPLSLPLYGAFLKVLPDVLLSVRLVTLSLWCVVAAIYAATFTHIFRSARAALFATVFVTAASGYPGYSNNHILTAVGLALAACGWLRFDAAPSAKWLRWSFAGALICLFSRPLLMGYGVFFAWWLLFVLHPKVQDRVREGLVLSCVTLTLGLLFLLVHGSGLKAAYLPMPWAVLESKSYPNLHHLLPRVGLSDPHFVENFARRLRASLETGVFYFHYFMWPTFLGVMAYLFRQRAEIRGAAILGFFGLCASGDVLHYGFSDPTLEPAMWARGQYFIAPVFASFLLVTWPALLGKVEPWRKYLSRLALGVFALWSFFPFLIGLSHWKKFQFNEFEFRGLTGTLTHPERRPLLEAVTFINEKCKTTDYVVIPQYDPGLDRLLNCRDLFGNDSYFFTRMPWYKLRTGETPWATAGGNTNEQWIAEIIRANQPKFYLFQNNSPLATVCKEPGWKEKMFGEGTHGRLVCWKE